MDSIRFTNTTLALCLAASLAHGVEKSKWPRVAPVLFIHGVGSAPVMWGVSSDKESIPNNQPLFPAGDNSKTGGYFWYKHEVDSATSCHTPGSRYIDLFGTPATASLLLRVDYDCNHVPNSSVPYNWSNAVYNPWESPFQFSTSSNVPLMLGAYDRLQVKTSGLGRLQGWTNTYWRIGSPAGTYGTTIIHSTMPGVGPRFNGIETYDAYWGNGWEDGNPPDELIGKNGMMYGTMLTAFEHKWVKARYGKVSQVWNAPTGGSGTWVTKTWDTYTASEWSAFNTSKTQKPSDAEIKALCGLTPCTYAYTGPTAGADPIEHTHLFRNPYTGEYMARIVYSENKKGYTGEMFAEETRYGQIGQIYLTIKKVLDKYYVGLDGAPNWCTNGVDEPDAKIVLVGHSQGGVLSRAVCYPGFGATDQYDADQGFMPMYFPQAMIGQNYTDIDGSPKTMSFAFDVRKHIAGVVTTSSPHYGSPIGYLLDGLYAEHTRYLRDKATGGGLYQSIWSPDAMASLDNKFLGDIKSTAQSVIDAFNPVSYTPDPAEGFSSASISQLRNLNTNKYRTANLFSGADTIVSIVQGLAKWQKMDPSSTPAPSTPCASVTIGTSDVNHYRMYWQPEYDNWVRSFRLDENNNGGDAGNEHVNTVNATPEFSYFGDRLCEEQIGRSTRISQNDNPNLASPDAAYLQFNPFATVALGTPLPKTTATTAVADASLDQDTQDFLDCMNDLVSTPTRWIGGIASAFLPPVANPFLWYAASSVYPRGVGCLDKFKANANMTIQSEFHTLLTNGAEGLAFHPASTFLHRLNQKGGSSKPDERRPFPVRPDGTPIPFICVVNNVSSTNQTKYVVGPSANGDWTVNTLSQDLGFAYPDISKAGSLVKVSFTGYSHTLAGQMPDTLLGPFMYKDANNAWHLDRTRNVPQHQKDRNTLSNLIFGLAIGQSPVFANQGVGAADAEDIRTAYTQNDPDGYILQRNNRESVQGRYTRLKGVNPDEVYEPVALQLSATRDYYVVNTTVTVSSGQELFIPAGSRVVFSSGSIVIQDGGRLTFGGVPTFSKSDMTKYSTTLETQDGSMPNIQVLVNGRVKFPSPTAGLLKSRILIVKGGGPSIPYQLLPGKIGPAVSYPPNHLYATYDSKPYLEQVSNLIQSFKDFTLVSGAMVPIHLLLNQ